ncbi:MULTISPECIES: hypothetical protein [Kosmotoga]|jgi:hypothetical protein|uniref:Helix-turn-helix type 11 domain protein n=1 Tax=Kosmotoga olearia (strain ATCC BAA-1733 / DSM 21960 / TBF 19.5.1) TaxID=521045 RepID=C5CFV6_KOSOT|nr:MULTISPECIES: hypothetical protein [Kosmotoga]ACR80450.1 hypothetical protein Kole_1765 [Kosmotoga olearia TBF 19.5.1]OAA19378.1 hypothetical protein DU53_09995 [Kosmotoga sp. DU53]
MPENSRILWLHRMISEGKYPSLKDFANRFGISIRQAEREVHYLRNVLGAPVVYSRKEKGYRYVVPFELPVLFASLEKKSFREIDKCILLIEQAINQRKMLKVRLKDGSRELFCAYAFYKKKVLGIFESSEDAVILNLGEIKQLQLIGKSFAKPLVLDVRNIIENNCVKYAIVKLNEERNKVFFYDLLEFVKWVINQKNIKIEGPGSIFKELEMLRKRLNNLMEAGEESGKSPTEEQTRRV